MTTRQKVSQPATVKRYGQTLTVEPVVGSIVKLDNGRCEAMLAGEDFVDSGFAGCDFRFPLPNAGLEVAVNIHVTGRTVQQRNGAEWVRCKVEWVGDCEPSTFCGGWLRVDFGAEVTYVD